LVGLKAVGNGQPTAARELQPSPPQPSLTDEFRLERAGPGFAGSAVSGCQDRGGLGPAVPAQAAFPVTVAVAQRTIRALVDRTT
jgi:hypothetical protein